MATKRTYDTTDSSNSNSVNKRSKLENFDSETSVRFFSTKTFILQFIFLKIQFFKWIFIFFFFLKNRIR